MAKCKECGNEAENYKLCGNCKKEWKERRLKAYEITMESIVDLYWDTSKEFIDEMKLNEKRLKERGKI